MPHDLIGYLTGAIDPHQRDVIEDALRSDPDLQAQLADARKRLQPLDHLSVDDDPVPPGLISSVWAAIDQSDATNHQPSHRQPSRNQPSDAQTRWQSIALSAETSTPARSHRALDVAAIAMAAAVALAILLPTLIQYRSHARRILCGDHLRDFGTALVQFANRQPDRQLPALESRGPRSFAGMYAVRLNDAGLLPDKTIRWCPVQPSGSAPSIPTLAEIEHADVNRLFELQRTAGGHYAYTLGVQAAAGYQPPVYQSRTSFAVLSDWPAPVSNGHRGNLNVLYEDGSIRMVSHQSVETLPDHPFQNHNQRPEAGVTIDDASLAPSWRPPFADSLQR